MKRTKKLLAIMMTIAMMAAMMVGFAVAADPDGTVTVQNATIGQTYAGYKIFDATGSGEDVAYTIDSTSAWYDQVSATTSPFQLAPQGGTTYAVSYKDGKGEADVIAWAKDATKPATADLTATVASANAVQWTAVPYGYYYVTSTLGSVISVTTAAKDATIIDKNQTPNWDPEDPENPDDPGTPDKPGQPDGNTETGKFVSDNNTDWAKENTAKIGDTVYFKINAYAPKYNKDKAVTDYTFTDTIPAGLTLNDDVKVMLGTNDITGKCEITSSTDTLTIKFAVVGKTAVLADYPTEAHLTITYTAEVDTDAVYDNVNSVAMTWNEYDPYDPENPFTPGTPGDSTNPYDPLNPSNPTDPQNPDSPVQLADPDDTPDNSTTDTYVLGIAIEKHIDTVDGEALSGAGFKLYTKDTDDNYVEYALVLDGTKYIPGTTGVEVMVNSEGKATIFGLDEGTYYLKETTVPGGYNVVKEYTEVEISKDAATDGIVTEKIVNKKGSTLPSTGGIGTTIFYVVGSILAIGAVVLFITKKRMDAKR